MVSRYHWWVFADRAYRVPVDATLQKLPSPVNGRGDGGEGVRATLSVLLILAFGLPTTAYAHKLHVFAHVEGNSILGNAYFPGGTAAQNVPVIARDATAKELARTITNEKGDFTLTAQVRIDHHLSVETPDGHRAECTVRAAELPPSVPASEAASNLQTGPSIAIDSETKLPSATEIELAAIKVQVIELRLQIDRYEAQTRFRDILGGIGFILGLAGIGFYVKAVKR